MYFIVVFKGKSKAACIKNTIQTDSPFKLILINFGWII